MNKILILGGTKFIGRNLVESLLQIDNLDLTLFNRGKTNPNIFPDVKKIVGDRNTDDINLILDGEWDYIIDLSCYYPKSLSQIVPQLSPSLKRYVFISTCSVYDMDAEKSILRNENAPILSCTELQSVDTTVESYGNRKAQCEKIIKQSDLRYTIFRPALVYGQYDHSDRFYYWPYQLKNNHDLLVPNNGKSMFSLTYVKDLVNAIIKTLNTDLISDTYNITTCPKTSISNLIDIASELLKTKPKICNADSNFLNSNNISEWYDLPLWLDCDYYTFDNRKILKDLEIEVTDFKFSVMQTIGYYNKVGWNVPKNGISEDVKKTLIDKL